MLTEEDKAVLAHLVEDPDAWIKHAIQTVGVDAVIAKCRRETHLAAYRAAKQNADYKPRGKLPSDETCALVAVEWAKKEFLLVSGPIIHTGVLNNAD